MGVNPTLPWKVPAKAILQFDDHTKVVTGDLVNSPNHYTVGGFEAIDVIKAKLTPEEFRGYLKGNILKYLMRANYKGKHNEDCKKAGWYAVELAEYVEYMETLPSEMLEDLVAAEG